MNTIILTERNGYPKTIKIETKELLNGFISLATDDFDEDIAKFQHSELRSRLLWVDGYFKALRDKKSMKKIYTF